MTRISRHEFCRNGTLDGYTIATELPLHGNLYPPTRIPPSCTKNYEISTMLDHRGFHVGSHIRVVQDDYDRSWPKVSNEKLYNSSFLVLVIPETSYNPRCREAKNSLEVAVQTWPIYEPQKDETSESWRSAYEEIKIRSCRVRDIKVVSLIKRHKSGSMQKR
ncbi:hypothetical protein V1477_010803 [Vespula maculifrons]|uniref:Uncharacterized protein n=3 Tax=Vespula TaxID=7451 RepID=A0A834KIE9_VESVU|nr:hypothetical protein HZH66_004265 [Vespula vulgaris]